MEISINYIAVIVAALASMVLGGLWYSPLLLGNAWIKEMGWSAKQCEEAQKNAGPSYFIGLLSQLLMAFVMAHLIGLLSLNTWQEGLQLALWIWLGFIATIQLGSTLWEMKSKKLFFINSAYWMVSLGLMASILGAWR